ncbi:hypothetical protein RND71_006605 [Anisodus tanguticus]|uniref:TCP domain-containing protein n=1 Tax=Anisodus tanguticus TaxID=243964 RepID=A0AAE1SR48_9SOLA|nr:hypothetical protein RND71_006605 [Anisodus tanguticus]
MATAHSPRPDNLRHKRTCDRHLKINGKDRRVRVSDACARKIDLLKEKLDHKMDGLTIEWLLEKAKPFIDVILTQKTSVFANTKSSLPQTLLPTVEKPIPTSNPQNRSVLPPLVYSHELDLDNMEFSKEEVEWLVSTCLSE